MADRLDVAERLGEGRPSVERTQTYVRACHALGYGHPDLTGRPNQLLDWYDSEDGLDLLALDRDCAQLRTASSAVTEALRIQRAQATELAAAWTGPGGEAAARFLERHCDAGATAATELRAAAQRCESLRDNLWYLVDSKVATAIAVDERTRAQRPEWLAAATAVTTGAGDRAAAEEVVHAQIGPYVDEDVRIDWLTTMRSTVGGVATSYDMVIDRMAAAPSAGFEFPADLQPGARPLVTAAPPVAPPTVIPAPAPTAPVADVAAPSPVAAAPAPAAPVAAPPPDPGTGVGDALGAPAGDLGGGGLGGLAGLAGRIVDAMGGLIEGGDGLDDDYPHLPDEADEADEADQADEADEPEEPEEPDEPREAGEPEHADGPKQADAAAQPLAVPAPAGPAVNEPAARNDPPPPNGPPTPVAAPRPGGPPAPGNEGSTPCEVAADQLPQAGQ